MRFCRICRFRGESFKGSFWVPWGPFGVPLGPRSDLPCARLKSTKKRQCRQGFGYIGNLATLYRIFFFPEVSVAHGFLTLLLPPWARPRRAGAGPGPARRGRAQGGSKSVKKQLPTLNSGKEKSYRVLLDPQCRQNLVYTVVFSTFETRAGQIRSGSHLYIHIQDI